MCASNRRDSTLSAINFEHIVTTVYTDTLRLVPVSIRDLSTEETLFQGSLSDSFLPDGDSRGREFNLALEEAVQLSAGKTYELLVTLPDSDAGLNLYGLIGLKLTKAAGESLRQAVKKPAGADTANLTRSPSPPNATLNFPRLNIPCSDMETSGPQSE